MNIDQTPIEKAVDNQENPEINNLKETIANLTQLNAIYERNNKLQEEEISYLKACLGIDERKKINGSHNAKMNVIKGLDK